VLDTVLAGGMHGHTLEPMALALMRTATASQSISAINPHLRVPYAVQAMVMAPALYDELSRDLWATVTGAPDIDQVRAALFS
jgi:hypothetical protein